NLSKSHTRRECFTSCKAEQPRKDHYDPLPPDIHGGQMKTRRSAVLKRTMPLERMDLTQARLWIRCGSIPAIRAFVFALLLCVCSVQGWSQQDNQQQQRQQMRGLDEQVQQVKSDVLSIAAELNQLEEKLLYPSGTQVAIFVALTKGDQMRLDA